jgi:hypothetical protein
MAIQEKITQEDLALYEILRNPVLSGEFINNYDRGDWEESFEFTWYQKEMLCDFNSYEGISTARAVGKTVSLVSLILWIMIFNIFPDDYIVYTVPNKVHLEPVWLSLVRSLRSNSFLKQFISPNAGINSSSFLIRLLNGASLDCRIAGTSGTGANVIGLHSPFVLLDESGYYPWGTWIELQPVINTFTPGYRLVTAGVPTGLRELNVLWHTDQENSNYTKHRLSAFDNPRFSDEDEARAIEQYGDRESDDYIHLVLGEHGSAIFAVFDRRLFEISNYPVYKLVLNGIELKEKIQDYATKLSIFPMPPKNNGIVIGADLGYTDPTAIVILYLDNNNRLRFHGRIQLNKVSYSIQDRFIDMLDTKLKPVLIGMDAGHAGKAVSQRLLDADEFLHKDYRKRLLPIEFSSSIELGFDADGNEIKSKTKPYSVAVLQDYSNSHRLIYSSTDQEMITELERMTYVKNPSGDISYRTLTQRGGQRGDDHFTAALLCATLTHHLENEMILPGKRNVRLYTPRWNI